MGLKISVQGKVQGVFFRASTVDKARELNLKGFVRNEHDGSVYIEVEGPDPELKKFTDWCQHGPKHARVDHLKITEGDDWGYSSFEIRRI